MSYYFNMTSRLEITKADGRRVILGGLGQYGAIESIQIEESVQELGDNCKLVIPRNIKTFQGKTIREFLKEGDKAQVFFGYESYNLEFSGYIEKISGTSPIELRLADEFYHLRRNSFTLSYKSVTLRTLLQAIAPGYKIECLDVNLGKFLIDRASTYQVLKDLQDNYSFSTWIKGNTLYCQFAYDVRNVSKHRYTYYLCDERTNLPRKRFGNVRANNLTYERKETNNVRVEVVTTLTNGKKRKVIVGSKAKDASCRKVNLHGDRPESELKALAQKIFEGLAYDGYAGSITGYGWLRTKPSDALELIDFDFPERNGTYLIERVTTRYSSNGIERENTLSYKI